MLPARLIAGLLVIASALSGSAQVDLKRYDCLEWRCIGPYRGGRTVGVAGVPNQPNVFYIGVNNGGVWKTTDFGQTWNPIFDDQPTGSVGALAVAPSDPNTIYVGSGEGLQRPDLSTGDGIYKSTDGGKSWQHLGLRDGQQIASIIVDPNDKNRLYVAVLGHPYGANEERGVFRSTDGGATFSRMLYKDADTGAVALAFDPTNPQVVYADLYAARQGPWENGEWQGSGSGLYESTDGGETWTQLTQGLPSEKEGLGRIGFAIAPSDRKRMYAIVDASNGGVYRSEDAGTHWTKVNSEGRVWGRGSDFAEVRVDPKDPDTIYVANTSTYKSTDGGKTFTAWKGAPGGDDYHTIWINPKISQVICLASDQGATITVNGGETWSSWYNQPTAQFYHVITDNQVPYWVYGGQQESGSVGTSSRGNDGAISFRDWHPVGAEEYGYIAPDPLNPNIIYGGKLEKFDKITGQVQDVSPQPRRGEREYRFIRTAPLVFSSVDPHTLFFGGNILFKTTDGAHSWQVISPDLTREHPEVPDSIGVYKSKVPADMARRGVIYAVAPSPRDLGVIWAGTDDGLIHFTKDGGKTWKDVTPPPVTAWSKVSIIDAGHFDSNTAYAAVNRIRLDDMRPHIYRTHDGGNTWTEIVNGLPNDAPTNTVREDPVRKGLLFCGTERAVFFSLDDGDHWNPLRLNMAPSSVRDLVIHNADVVVGTHGRSFWILDDISVLRQMDSGSSDQLFKPEMAYRFRRDTNSDTPLPPEVPAGKNPPDGAIIDYFLAGPANGPMVIQILDASGTVVRSYSSDVVPYVPDPNGLQVPMYWVRIPKTPGTQAGSHRFVWDLYYEPPPVHFPFMPMGAIVHDTPPLPLSPIAPPGQYKVVLKVNGKTYTQPLTLKMDPRVAATAADIQEQSRLSKACYDMASQAGAMGMERKAVLDKLAEHRKNEKDPAKITALEAQIKLVTDLNPQPLAEALMNVMMLVDGADMRPTVAMTEQADVLKKQLETMRAQLTNATKH